MKVSDDGWQVRGQEKGALCSGRMECAGKGGRRQLRRWKRNAEGW